MSAHKEILDVVGQGKENSLSWYDKIHIHVDTEWIVKNTW